MVSDEERLRGIVEVDETYIGGIETKKHRRKKLGRWKRNRREADDGGHASKKRRYPRVSAG